MVFERRKLQNWPFYTTSAAFLSQNAPTDSAEEAEKKRLLATTWGFWDLTSGAPKPMPDTRPTFHQIAFSPDGKFFFANGSLWDVETVAKIRDYHSDRAMFSHDCGFLGMANAVWDLKTGSFVWGDDARDSSRIETAGLAFSPDDRLLIVGRCDGELRILDRSNGRAVNRLQVHKRTTFIVVSLDGRVMATVGIGEPVTLWRSALRDAQ